MITRPLAVITTITLAACSKPAAPDAVTHRTVGDTSFTSSPADGTSGPAQLVESFHLGPDRLEFGQLGAAAFGPNGEIWLYDVRGKNGETLHVLDSLGKPIAIAGHPGDGPGEYRGWAILVQLADRSMLLKVGGTTRALRFDSLGRAIATITLPVAAQNGSVLTPDNSGGWFIASAFEENTPLRVGRFGWLHFNQGGVVTDTVFPPARFFEEASPDGYSPARVRTVGRDSTVLTSANGQPRIDWITKDGKVRAAEWRAEPPRYADDERHDLQRVVDRMSDLLGKTHAPLPERKSAVRRILTDADGGVWAALSNVGEPIPADELPKEDPNPRAVLNPKWRDAQEKWGYFDRDAVLRFTVELPPRSHALDRNGDRILGVTLNADNVPTVVVWKVSMSGKPR